MANEAFVEVQAAKLFNGEAGADVAFSVEGITSGTGMVSAQHDLGASPRPFMFRWSCEVQFQATPTQYAGLELYVAGAPDADATQVDGDIGQSDAALGDIDMRRNLQYIGFVTSENAAASEKCVGSGVFKFYSRYISVVAFNASGASVNATDSNFRFDLQPLAYQGQA